MPLPQLGTSTSRVDPLAVLLPFSSSQGRERQESHKLGGPIRSLLVGVPKNVQVSGESNGCHRLCLIEMLHESTNRERVPQWRLTLSQMSQERGKCRAVPERPSDFIFTPLLSQFLDTSHTETAISSQESSNALYVVYSDHYSHRT